MVLNYFDCLRRVPPKGTITFRRMVLEVSECSTSYLIVMYTFLVGLTVCGGWDHMQHICRPINHPVLPVYVVFHAQVACCCCMHIGNEESCSYHALSFVKPV